MRTAAEARQELAHRLGFAPSHLPLEGQPPELLCSVVGQALSGHFANPLPAGFKQEVLLLVTRSAATRECIMAQCCELWALDFSARSLVSLLRSPTPASPRALTAALELADPIAEWPERGSALHDTLRDVSVALTGSGVPLAELFAELARVLGERWHGALMCFVLYARTYQAHLEMCPDAQFTLDARGRDALRAMLVEAPQLEVAIAAASRLRSAEREIARPLNALSRELTAAKAELHRLEEERARFLALSSELHSGLGPDGRWKHVHPALARALGYGEAVLLSMSFTDLVHPEDLERTRAALPALAGGEVLENRYRCADGSYRCFEWRAASDDEGELLVIARDLTEVRSAALAVETAQAQFRNAFEFSAIGMALVHLDGRWMRVNHALTTIIGYTEQELLGKTFQDITHPDHLAADLALLDKLIAGESESYQLEKRYFHRKGHVVWILLSVSLVRSSTGEPLHFISQIQDISHRKAAEQKLRASEGRYRALSHQAPVGIFETDANGDCRFVNRRWQDMTGASSEQAAGQTWVAWVYQADRERVLAAFYEAASENREFAMEFRFQSLGGVAWVWGRALALRNDDGLVSGFLGTVMDITARKNAESALEETLREKETMLKEIHHRVKNNLQVISSLLYFQSKALPESGAQALFRESQDRVRSMALIHEKLYQSSNLSEIDFADYARGLTSELLRSYGSPFSEIDLVTELESVHMDLDLAIPCGLILNELFSNALKHAFAPGSSGTVKVELRRVAGNKAMLAVCDSGRGLPTGLDIAKASSLGLKLVRTFANQIDGRLHVESGRGAQFSVVFALPDTQASQPKQRVAS